MPTIEFKIDCAFKRSPVLIKAQAPESIIAHVVLYPLCAVVIFRGTILFATINLVSTVSL